VSTLEAVAALLRELEGGEEGPRVQEGLLEGLRMKVDAMCVQKNRPPAYNVVVRGMFAGLETKRDLANAALDAAKEVVGSSSGL
jgi:hypothetical protein